MCPGLYIINGPVIGKPVRELAPTANLRKYSKNFCAVLALLWGAKRPVTWNEVPDQTWEAVRSESAPL